MTDFHEGERAVQLEAGVAARARRLDGMVQPVIPPTFVAFLEHQQMVVLASTDASGRVWASLRTGPPGFLHVDDPTTLEIRGLGAEEDPLLENLATESPAGFLAIELATKRRVRLNGDAVATGDGTIRLRVRQVYGNCPKYIHARAITGERAARQRHALRAAALDARQSAWIARADTCFLATSHPTAGADASHRGGPAGFLRVDGPQRLQFPDYPGNNLFNSLGNLSVNPRAGLLVPDFESGAALSLTGRATVVWEPDRHVEFEIDAVLELPDALRITFGSARPSNDAPACTP